ncbi:type 1 fimbrial protein [Citrobacter sp. CRE-46]|nr:type 1 fimbrial protein [Citrobacter sp. CRE-46]
MGTLIMRVQKNTTDNYEYVFLNEERIMSKLSLVALIACAVSIPSAMAFGDPHGYVNFKGSVLPNSCKIENQGYKEVQLSPVINTLVNKDAPVQVKKFSIKVKDCYMDENLIPRLSWGKNSHITNDGYLKNTLMIGSNAALRLETTEGKVIDLSHGENKFDPDSKFLSKDKTSLDYTFQVGYIKSKETNLPIIPGGVKAQAHYSITYN